jgi:PHD/YefM family antitoxin component YafN of YafNO toxin-antitoxin module
MKTITIQDIKRHGAKSISGDDPIYLIVNSKPLCVMVPVDHFEALEEALEDLDAIKTFEERKNEETVPMDDVISRFEKK